MQPITPLPTLLHQAECLESLLERTLSTGVSMRAKYSYCLFQLLYGM
jgi:hypothetical protein